MILEEYIRMAKNKEFFDALGEIAKSAKSDETLRDELAKVLDDILKTDPSDPDAFRKIIVEHQEFWDEHDPSLMEFNEGLFFGPSTEEYLESDDFLDSNDTTNSFQKLHQLAAEQRVKLGLEKSDTDTLVAILKNNPEECRAYIESKKPALGNFSEGNVHGWLKEEYTPTIPPKAINKSTDVLSDRAIKKIKEQASELLLLKLIKNCENRQLLKDLQTANSKTEAEHAANALGFPTEGNGELSYPLSDEVEEALDDIIQELEEKAAKAGFDSYVQSLSHDALLAKKDGLESTTAAGFKNSLDEPYKTYLPESEWERAQGVLGARYLQAVLSSGTQNLKDALNAKDANALIAELKKPALLGPHDYIDKAVTEENLGSLKKNMMKSFINNIKDETNLKALDALKALDGAKNLDKFKEVLGKLGITPADWVKDTDLKDMKQWARARQFELEINRVSSLGSGAHSKLMSTLTQLPVEKQREILAKPQQLRHLMNAYESHVAEHYLGKNASGIAELLTENKRLEGFRAIHNAEVARVLANFKPEITLNDKQVAAINQALTTANSNPNTYTQATDYKTLIDAIKTQSGSVNQKDFYNAFNLNDDGRAFTSSTPRKDEMSKQQQHNQHIYAEYNSTSNSGNKKLLAVLLSIEKPVTFSKDIVNRFLRPLKDSETPQEYADRLFGENPTNPANKKFKDDLLRELTPTLFNEIKNDLRKQELLDTNPANVMSAIKALSTELESIKGITGPIRTNADKLKFINDIDPVHLYNPTFQGTARSKAAQMKERYEGLSRDCELVVDQLRRQVIALEGHLKSLPKDGQFKAAGLTLEQKEEIKKLRTDLQAELDAVRKDLDFYKKIQGKLETIVKEVDVAAKGKMHYYYNSEGIKRHPPVSRDQIPPLPNVPNPSLRSSTTATTGSNGRIQEFLVGEKIPEGQIVVVDVSHKTAPKSGAPVETIGRYTQDNNVPDQVTSKKGEISKVPGSKFEILQFPTQVPPPNPPSGDPLVEAKVNFSMAMAADILASLDSPPTKDKPIRLRGSNPEELEYLYTALVILGEKNPKFKFNRDAIEVNSAVFHPDNVKGRLWGFSSNSLYSQVFTNTGLTEAQNIIQSKIKHMQQMTDEKFSPQKEREKVDSKVQEITDKQSKMKKELNPVHKTTERTIEQEGPAPESPSTGMRK
ncbi:TPA: Dot/Icm T4SS effector Ceg28 [Legionella pneumophila]|uniref:Dot/Icm T4SS effector Ceg28 n=1 Tax=Legionella pneumophila TaxID=446 RepID=UPI0009B48298|nr:Dot/Icm T4SS effector Ceg28 [Legionella pneumophila]HAT9014133.1 Dot/Icm T4SS effector Ceg28 [Legionella pneumophila subsp. pneumophila]HAT1876428.1 Dot/Icm T4SS effector Ceg28 [Legionella pneumophila]HAT9215322.1 Dot/Icm T4SS effector Ceg28 [Legionella pneumophila subsp. pneumophila]HAT9261454.1 Dot/Icm T4SS effector Ceg28 [Legionella pneumophila subsp. pneumophila]HAT9283569.1 Dot/Icm T4SS effector Ceg28 [Legionella pneumophila subsp. pneumophila]